MRERILTTCRRIAALASLLLVPASAAEPPKTALDLRECAIVLPNPAAPAERYAAKELGEFIRAAVGTAPAVISEKEPERKSEIRLGAARLSASEAAEPLPVSAGNPEAYVIRPENGHVRLRGNSARGTLYAAYDLLETDLGIRFLAPDATYVPQSEGRVEVAARSFEPVLEYRNIYCDPVWAVRNRLNASWTLIPLEEVTGGIKWIGPSFVHTFHYLVPPEKYRNTHPEYFSLIDGKRLIDHSQLCLTNPDVADLAEAEIRKWIAEAKKSPDTQYLVSVSGNDWGNCCQCPECAKVNAEEQSQSGTLWRFINRLAERLEKDHPEVRLETLAYNWSFNPPAATRPNPRVVVRLAPIDGDFGRPISDASHGNGEVLKQLRNWQDRAGKLYVWDYVTNFDAYFSPFPNLRAIGENIRIYADAGVKGYYGQGTQTPGGEMALLRNYLLAKCMWNPQADSSATVEEFCRLYYGEAASKAILEYIDLLHREFLSQDTRLSIRRTPPCMMFTDEFLQAADQLLAEAEKQAETPEQKARVAVFRLPVWYEMLEKEFARHGVIAQLPTEWFFRTDPEKRGRREAWFQPDSSAVAAEKIRIDAPWTAQQHPNYHGVAWYRTGFEIPESAVGRELALYFGAVDGLCTVYLDGREIGSQKKPPEMMWNKGFYLELPADIRPGPHTLAVEVSKDSFSAGIWKPVALIDRQSRLPTGVREAAERFPQVADTAGVTHLSEFYGRPRAQLEEDFYPRIQALLNRRAAPVPDMSAKRFYPTDFANVHRTFRMETEDSATRGAVLVQQPGAWSLNQAIQIGIPPELQKRTPSGAPAKFKVRVRVTGLSNKRGDVFSFGCRTVEPDWSGTILAEQTVTRKDCSDKWKEFQVALPQFKPGVNYSLFLKAADGSGVFSAVHLDYFELSEE